MPSGGYRAGVPLQAPYSKYECTDTDEIRVEYKRVENNNSPVHSGGSGGGGGGGLSGRLSSSRASSLSGLGLGSLGGHSGGPSSWFSGCKGAVLRLLVVVVVFMLGMVFGYIIRRVVREMALQPETCVGSSADGRLFDQTGSAFGYQEYNTEISRQLKQLISAESIEQNLRNYTLAVHISGTSGNNRLHDYLHQQLSQLHMMVAEANYRVMLSYHDWERSNVVHLLNDNGTISYSTGYRGPPVNGDPRSADHPELTESYAAYSPNGTAEGEIVYANYGEEKDFKLLAAKGVSCQNKVVIMRYGRIFPGQMVSHAEECGAVGVLLYPDPSEVFDSGSDATVAYPESRYLPGWATRRGSLWRYGDPLTPSLPSRDYVHRIPLHETKLPSIPVQPISFDDAYQLMSHMKGPFDSDFLGLMHGNITYHMGPGYQSPQENWKVRVEVFNDLELREITNIFGVIKGREEPDRYIIVGCHYDAWTYGGVEPGTGSAVLMEIAKSFSSLIAKGWHPRRTIIFANWDAGEMGQIGSYEWVEENLISLADRTVAYINLDEAVSGNYVIDVESSPMLHEVIMNASRQTPPSTTFDTVEPAATPESLYDVWIQRSPSDTDNFAPRFNYPSPNSDHAPFVYRLGCPVMWPRYVDNTNSASARQYPAYHTVVDSFDYVKRFIDPTFSGHVSIARLVAEVVLQLSSSQRLPLDVRELADVLETEYDSLLQDSMDEFKYAFDHLQRAIRTLSEAAALFYDSFLHVDSSNELEMRRYNDRLMMVSKAFVHPSLPFTKQQIRNVLFGPSEMNSYEFSTFSGIRDALSLFTRSRSSSDPQQLNQARAQVEQQVSMATLAVQSASSILSEDDVFR